MIHEKVRDKLFKRLGIEPLPAKGEYFVSLHDYSCITKQPQNVDKEFDTALNGPWVAKDCPIIVGWLKANEKSLALAQKAAQRPRYFAPLMATSDFAPVIAASDFAPLFANNIGSSCYVRLFAKTMTCRAMLKSGSGDIEGMWADLLSVQKMGRHIGQGSLLHDYLDGLWINLFARYHMAKVAVSGKLTAKQAKRFLAEYNELPRWNFFPAMQNERLFALEMLLFIAKGGQPCHLFGFDRAQKIEALLNMIDWNEVLRTINSRYDRQVKIFRLPNASERKLAQTKFDKEIQKLVADYSRIKGPWPEGPGVTELNALIDKAKKSKPQEHKQITQDMANLTIAVLFSSFRGSIMLFSVGGLIELQESQIMHDELVGVALALAAHKAEKGAYPQKLAELSPAYLKTIPADRFSGKPLIYKTQDKGFLLYSVGRNLKDNGGKDEASDIVIEAKRQ
ncbi:MAG: hypothetical protein K8S55_10375 [Phycisphaerae bacterium]|nr:hypothetical protein [Phycisphaerae bacterium]